MAIKSFHPRKHLEHELHSLRFERLVADAWEEVHEPQDPSSTPHAESNSESARPVTRAYRDDPPSNQPFAALGDELKQH